MNYYISDLHIGHKNVLGFDGRPFSSIEENDTEIMRRWNEKVCSDDTVYILGDFCYRNEKPAEWYLQKLRGHKILIQGNHDGPLLENPKAMHYFEGVEKMMHVQDGNTHICLCHFPIAEWNGFYHGTWHIYGHIHAHVDATAEFMRTREHALNAGCMINNYTPASFRELVENNERFNKELGKK